MSGNIRVLIVDDVSANLNLLAELLENEGYEVLAAPSGAIALDILKEVSVDLIVLDILMPGLDGISTCQGIMALLETPPPIIFISAGSQAEQLARAFDAGGVDYITKPFFNHEVLARARNQLKIAQLQNELRYRNRELEEQISRREQAEDALSVASETLTHLGRREIDHWGLPAFIGNSRQFKQIDEQIRQLRNFARTNVLILGESGSGKELVARALHFGSDLRDKPFIAINCSAISEPLAEAEFFGSVKGAFTGATTDRKGFFEIADGGTLFLDEVGDLPLAIQAKLLRALEDGSFFPVGANSPKSVKVRILSATNNNLEQKKQERLFREDLYFRLAQFTLQVPPLRERVEDIPCLARHFIQSFSLQMKIKPPDITGPALMKLRQYGYPGNIRELKNLIERAIILSQGRSIDEEYIQLPTQASPLAVNLRSRSFSIRDVKRELADIALEQCGGNVTAAAKLIGVHRSWFYRIEEKVKE